MLNYPCTIQIHGISCDVMNKAEHDTFLGQLKFGVFAADMYSRLTPSQRAKAADKFMEPGFDAPVALSMGLRK